MEPRVDIPERIIRNIAKSIECSTNLSNQVNRLNAVLFFTSIFSAAATTVITTLAATQGPIIGAGTEGWKLSCMIAALFGFVATFAEGFKAHTHERVTRSRICIERLKLLDMSVRYSQRPVEEIDRELDDIARTYPEALHI